VGDSPRDASLLRAAGHASYVRPDHLDGLEPGPETVNKNDLVAQRDSNPCFSHDHVFATSITSCKTTEPATSARD